MGQCQKPLAVPAFNVNFFGIYTMDGELSERITKIYNLKTYMDRYGLDVWIAVFVCTVFIIATVYYHIKNKLEPIKADWINQRCKPSVLPFAGMINKPVGVTNLEFTAKNFTGCVQNILTYVVNAAFQPFYYAIQIVSMVQKQLVEAVNAIRGVFDRIRSTAQDITNQIYSMIMNIVVEIIHLIVNMKDMSQKITGTLTASIYTMIGAYISFKSLMGFLLELFITVLWIMVGTITGLLIITLLPFGMGAWAVVPSLAMIAFGIFLLTLLVPLCQMLANVLDISHRPIPAIPGCFAPDTPIEVQFMDDCRSVPISDIQIGDQLQDGVKVTGTITFSAHGQTIYNLNGVVVTGEHRVYYQEKWIQVKNHPDSRPLPSDAYPHDKVFCLMTDSKTFHIEDTLYSDWDDIDDTVLTALERNCVAHGFLPKDFTTYDIHRYLDAGLAKNTKIEMLYGGPKTIDTIQINDVLCNGERVVGTVKINGRDIGVYQYGPLRCSRNIQLSDNTLGKINLMTKIPGDEWQVFADGPYLYHLLTDTGYFVANGVTVAHYNSAIDSYVLS